MDYRLIIIFFFTSIIYAQENLPKIDLSLEDAIDLAQKQSIDYLTAKNSAEVGYWGYKSYKSIFFPSVNVSGILPNYQKSINRITADDGTDTFINQNQAFSSLSLEINQIVPFTGGEFTISSSLNRIDVLSSPNFVNYSSTPLSIQYSHESLLYNPYKWQKKIEPLIFEESKREFQEKLEDISLKTTTLFFNYLLAEVKSKNALNNKVSQDTIYKISKGRFNIGKLYENNLLQSELSFLNSKEDLIKSKNELKLAKQAFLDQLGIKNDANFNLITPEKLIFIKIDSIQLFDKALSNRKLLVEQEREVLEVKQEISKIKSDDIKLGIRGDFGLSQQNELLNEVYSNLLSQQNFSLTVSAPIFTWGKRKADKKIAISNLELIKSENEQELLTVKRELNLKYLEWNQLEISSQISKKASEIAVKRYESAKQRFSIGKVTITDLNIAQNEKDDALYNYYQSLREYWELYYEIRKLTLYDFIKDKNIYENFTN